ncbi:tyrosine-type recombinase/integrase [uncultured Clostridium sp.]|uniref:tyrosine-type recombinase/integrase n=1 Tax=uncultured Clostridium sp. TaxID=59620 RepID=UPI0037DC975C
MKKKELGIAHFIMKIGQELKNDRIFELVKKSLAYKFQRICKKSGVKQIRLHDLRHSYASLLIELGFTPLLVSERLGHEKIQTTLDIYSHLYTNKDIVVAKKLDSLY